MEAEKLSRNDLEENIVTIKINKSYRDGMSQTQTESYTAAKGGISALTHALMMSLAGKVRVNSISPGWIDTDYKVYEGKVLAGYRMTVSRRFFPCGPFFLDTFLDRRYTQFIKLYNKC